MKKEIESIARIFEDTNGYYFCDDLEGFLDARGYAFESKIEAIRAAANDGYSHAIGSGTYWKGVKSIRGYKTSGGQLVADLSAALAPANDALKTATLASNESQRLDQLAERLDRGFINLLTNNNKQ